MSFPRVRTAKHRNVKVEGFDSKGERDRYNDLALLQRAGKISDLQKQVRFDFIHNGIKICSYVADFTYVENGQKVTEDWKSKITRKNPTYIIKRKMMKAFYGIEIRETGS